ncbi:MAG: SpoIIE family protein phosphatase [Planctomycetes bacterium]|nr:SpoIIE family protein phosphatase [Planctomycetota bacterium]
MEAAGADAAWLVVHHPDGTRHHHRLTLALTTLGRSEQNVVEVLDPKLSRFHCEVERRAGVWLLRDCNSRNGTLLNGEPVVSPRPLRHRDRVTIGRTTIEFLTAPPDGLRDDPAMAIPAPAPIFDDVEAAPDPAPDPEARREAPTSVGRRTTLSFDPRQTMKVEQGPLIPKGEPWRVVARAAIDGLTATSRAALIDRAVVDARDLVQARGALLALAGERPDAGLTVSAALGLDAEGRERCLEAARRVVVTRERAIDDRRILAVPVRGARRLEGALVLHDLPAQPAADAAELEALEALAAALARTLSTSLLLEEVRRGERAQHAERLAHDLRRALLAEPEASLAAVAPGLDVGFARAPAAEAGRDLAVRVLAPPRAGRQELFIALAETPDPDAPPPARLRRRGERGFVPLLGQAELCGALRALVAVLPRTDEVLLHLDRTLRQGGAPGRAAIALLRYDPTTGALRLSGAGHAPLVLRRASGAVETALPLTPALGAGPEPRLSERELRWEPGDLLVAVTAAAARATPRPPAPPVGEQGLRQLALSLDPAEPAARSAERVVDALLRAHDVTDLPDAAALVLRRTP